MPRRSGAKTSASAPQRSAPPPAAAPRQHAPPPAAAPAAPPPAAAPAGGGGMMSGLMGSMASGMAAGVGMSVANRAVDAVMGPRQTEVVHRNEGAPPAAAGAGLCQVQNEQLMQCMKSSSDASSCQHYMDALKACQQQQ
mmetsp:Transcript_85871/g.152086  ORF Transcript_85871/g.152086 Transcript_85871/m.152086 type:complete len:139 (-) Transcript_85871:250-666(-)|eukprot:CAMPEP_0197654866 /NCGR_PEP_ID=MMETSP1338-20131121/39110_1 /TAXON_ID=43686 ORGANISM="Pelagodinium beii, Strain RCC1491" /NCGR_SAMPLE_ID=MMETSP1338 /ASSEMBLY_ACC=CAM_ASM_000754 /LENGTH=138 /DNA_ID=CAMNT_0043230395 /DNA_START=49 /DNA_END=465 /DNA_ORIENTATION=+